MIVKFLVKNKKDANPKKAIDFPDFPGLAAEALVGCLPLSDPPGGTSRFPEGTNAFPGGTPIVEYNKVFFPNFYIL